MKYVVLALCACLALAGCGSDPAAQPAPTPSTSSPVATPTTKDPETPQQFLRRWVSAMDEMESTGETKPWERMNLPACADCRTVAASVRGVYLQGRHVRGSRTVVVAVKRLSGGRWRLNLKSDPTTVVDKRGKIWGQFPGGATTMEIKVVRSSGAWKVAAATRIGARQ